MTDEIYLITEDELSIIESMLGQDKDMPCMMARIRARNYERVLRDILDRK